MSGNAQEWESKITWDAGADPITDGEYGQILQSIFPEAWAGAAVDFHYTLKARHFIYSHTAQGEPLVHNGEITQYSDCTQSGAAPNLGSLKTQGVIETGIALGLKFDPEPISKTILGIVDGVMSFITKHHAQAVALEQKDICQATTYANQGFDIIDAGFYSQQMTQAQAIQALANMRMELEQIVNPVQTASGRTKSTCNAACVNMLFFDGLVKLRSDYLYPQHTFPVVAKVLPTAVTSGISSIGTVVSNGISSLSGGAIKISAGIAFMFILILIAFGIGIVKVNKP